MLSSLNRFASSKSCKQHDLEHRISKQPVLKLKFQNRFIMLAHKTRRACSICSPDTARLLAFQGRQPYRPCPFLCVLLYNKTHLPFVTNLRQQTNLPAPSSRRHCLCTFAAAPSALLYCLRSVFRSH